MIRGTTPTLLFTLPFEVDKIQICYIAFAQNNKIILEKTSNDNDIEFENTDTLKVKLTQDETLLFEEDVIVEIQLRIKTVSNDVLASNIIKEKVEKILKDGVI